MMSLKKFAVLIGLTASLGGMTTLAEPAMAFPAAGIATTNAEAQTGTSLPVEHVQYYGGYGYGYPCVFPFRCGYGYGRGYYGRGYGYGRGFYGRGYGYGRGGYGRGGYGRGYRR